MFQYITQYIAQIIETNEGILPELQHFLLPVSQNIKTCSHRVQ